MDHLTSPNQLLIIFFKPNFLCFFSETLPAEMKSISTYNTTFPTTLLTSYVSTILFFSLLYPRAAAVMKNLFCGSTSGFSPCLLFPEPGFLSRLPMPEGITSCFFTSGSHGLFASFCFHSALPLYSDIICSQVSLKKVMTAFP